MSVIWVAHETCATTGHILCPVKIRL